MTHEHLLNFPDPRNALGPEGLVALGGQLTPENLKNAYRIGVFPWPTPGFPLAWYCPEERAILFLKDFHISRSLAKTLKQHPFRLSIDENFGGVIEACSKAPRKGQGPESWITPEMIEGYAKLHQDGWAHSVECWKGDQLVGGVYGVSADGVFAAESMFHTEPNASKIALAHLIEHLKSKNAKWVDFQVINPFTESLGTSVIPRDQYLTLLHEGRQRHLSLF